MLLMLDNNEIILRLVLAAILGSIVGWERESKDGPAGLRTHMLVCTGSALSMIVSAYGFEDMVGLANVSIDPSRVAAQVISGIGFLGAGTIFFLRQHIVKGLTTAAGLWSVAAVGLAIGCGMYVASLVSILIIFMILSLVKHVERYFFKDNKANTISINADKTKFNLSMLDAILKENELVPDELILHADEKGSDHIRVTFVPRSSRAAILKTVDTLNTTEGVLEITSHV